MYRIAKKYTFDAAHQLGGHEGKCANLHGHTYSIGVWIKGEVLDDTDPSSNGMVLDYGDLDVIVKPLIEAMDHSFLIEGHEPSYVALVRAGITKKYCNIGMRTTAENLATFIVREILVNGLPSNIKLLGVRVSETPKTYAEHIVEV